jgi:hypothetical protein
MRKLRNKPRSPDGAAVVEPNKGEEAEWAGAEEPKTSPVDEEARLDPTLGAIRICG